MGTQSLTKTKGDNMFGLKKKMGRPTKRVEGRAVYKQVAVTPQAHAKISQLADKSNKSIIDTVDVLVGV